MLQKIGYIVSTALISKMYLNQLKLSDFIIYFAKCYIMCIYYFVPLNMLDDLP